MTQRSSTSALVLVLAAVVSVQFGAAVAVTLVPEIGAGGSVVLRLGLAAVVMLAVARPQLRGHDRAAWRAVVLYGASMGLMNLCFYSSIGRLPMGVAVTIEFLGPLTLATVLSRRPRDLAAVGAAAVGVLLISEALSTPLADLEWRGMAFAALAGAFWAAYILTSRAAGRAFPRLDGLAVATVVALVVALPFGAPAIPRWDGDILLRGLGIALLSSVIPYSLELLALRRLSAKVFGILLSLEPAVAAGSAFVVLHQRLTWLQVGGMAMVVLASALVMGAGEEPEPDDLEHGSAQSGA